MEFTNELSLDLLVQALSAVLSAQRNSEVTVTLAKKTEDKK